MSTHMYGRRFIAGLLTWSLGVSVQSAEVGDCTGNEVKGATCLMEVSAIHPTQFAVGSVAVECKKKQKLEKKSSKKLKKYLQNERRHVPAVVGPEGRFFITDHHHLTTALYRAKTDDWTGKDQKVYIDVLQNYGSTGISQQEFWRIMEMEKNVWPYDGNGEPVADYGSKLARIGLGDMQDNPYRTLSRWVRESCGYLKTGKDQCNALEAGQSSAPFFMEFYWARYLREKVKLDTTSAKAIQKKYPQAITAVLDKEASQQFFRQQDLDAEDYGQNQEGTYLHLKFTGKSCEQWWLDSGDGA